MPRISRNPLIESLETLLTDYIILPENSPTVLAAWIISGWLHQVWDHFPHLAIVSPEKRCGKTTLLELLSFVCQNPRTTANISPAALYRIIDKYHPTLLMDEAQCLSRQGSEAMQVIREILNAGIGRHAKAIRCGGKNKDEIFEFSVYCPKVFALIGEPDGVLADRCVHVRMKRKTEETRKRFRIRDVEPFAISVKWEIEKWTIDMVGDAPKVYDKMKPFDIPNDRMAELLIPLQTVLTLSDDPIGLRNLEAFAVGLEKEEKLADSQSIGIQLLEACRQIFSGRDFLLTEELLTSLHKREEEPWKAINKGRELNPEGLAKLLRPFEIRSGRNPNQRRRGYHAASFKDAWTRYLSS